MMLIDDCSCWLMSCETVRSVLLRAEHFKYASSVELTLHMSE